MLVHIVNSANRTFYANYLEEMFRVRKEIFIDALGWKELKETDGKEMDDMDFVDGVEYLLIIDSSGELVGHCRCNPTTKPHLLNGPLSHFVQRPVELGYECWEFTRFAPTRTPKSPHKDKALAYLCAGSLEWAMTKGIKRLLGIAEAPLIGLSTRLGWPTRMLGMPVEYEAGKEASALEFSVTKTALESTRLYFGLNSPVTYTSPPQMDYRTISSEQISFIDAAYHAVEDEHHQKYAAE